MNLRQICNYVYAVRTAGDQEQKDLDEFHEWLYAPLDTRKAQAERELMRQIRGY